MTVAASSIPQIDQEEPRPASIHILPPEVLTLIIGQLPPKDFALAAEVCHLWKNIHTKALIPALREEAKHMLFDQDDLSDKLSPDTLAQIFQELFRQEGFVFVPFGQPMLPGDVLCDNDVAPYPPQLYKHAFGEEKENLSPQDILCLEAVLPWSRMVVKPHADAKKRAVQFLLATERNPHLVRLSPTLKPEDYNTARHTFLMTTEEGNCNIYFLNAIINGRSFKLSIDHHLHIVFERKDDSARCKSILFRFPPYDLTLSDPKGVEVSLLHVHDPSNAHFYSMTLRGFNSVTTIGEYFCSHQESINSLKIKGLESVTTVGTNSFYGCQTLNDASRRRLRAFYQQVEARPQGIVHPLRSCPFRDNGEIYFLYNPDIKALAEKSDKDLTAYAQEHYQTIGFKEARRYNLPKNFVVEDYLYLNPDVAAYAQTQADPKKFGIWHFITHAPKEGRIYRFDLPWNFSAENYLAHNQDLTEYARSETLEERDQKLKIHYLRHGSAEGRQF